jgi:phage portal protein BeeE
MQTIVERAFSDAAELSKSYQASASKAIAARAGGGRGNPYSQDSTARGPFDQTDVSTPIRQYKALRDIPWTAIRPAAVKIASLPVLVGTKESAESKRAKAPNKPGKMRTKSYVFDRSPAFIQKQLTEGLEAIENHPLLDDLANPNSYMTGWALKFCTAVSLRTTGKSYWWIMPVTREDGSKRFEYYYLPTHWVKPVHLEGRPFAGWRVTPPGTPTKENEPPIPYESLAYFCFPDPENPLEGFSELQSQARAVNTDDEIQKAQYASMRNGINPGVVIKGGHLPAKPGESGQGPRVEFTPEQRKQLIDSIRLQYAGTMHWGDPIITDALIEDVYPFTRSPAELALLEGSTLTKDRIMQGMGVNPIVAGQIENANRASAYVAHDGFYQLVVNPLGTLISEVLTERVAPLYSAAGTKLYAWLEEAKAHDEDLRLSKITLLCANQAIKKDELREFADLKPLGKENGGEEWASPPQPPVAEDGPAGATKPTRPKPAAKKKDFDPSQPRASLNGRWSGPSVPAADVLNRIRKSPQWAEQNIDWEAYAARWGVRGTFHYADVRIDVLAGMLETGSLGISQSLSEEEIATKIESGEFNPIVITRTPAERSPLFVLDGSHSLTAAIRSYLPLAEDAAVPRVRVIVSDEAAVYWGLDL